MQALEAWSWVAGIGSFFVSFVSLLLAGYTAWPTFVARREAKRSKEKAELRAEIRAAVREELAARAAAEAEAERRRAAVEAGEPPYGPPRPSTPSPGVPPGQFGQPASAGQAGQGWPRSTKVLGLVAVVASALGVLIFMVPML
ncbi:hypothetical protein QFW96_26945 [Saccharopolyspora sp. TS4A08]|uniref:Uncharacterized protein n=1 Tax=Saccharopolyspora ipomoeae TaxID=3042027 RepID=A0ABT6PW99_9PSEU|nr:hypothetical protein [Saccharopolyspora sp. TS4A08]MDI2032285.1 hypothetical protein [Saccharopolyspora sp. TS4A08]